MIGKHAACGLVFAMVLTTWSTASADLIFYGTRPAFTAANPGLPVEGFESARVAPGAAFTFPNSLSSTTSNTAFSPGDIVPGFSVTNANSTNLMVLGNGTITGASKLVGTSTLGSSIDLDFGSEVTSLAADLYAASGPGATVPSSYRITLFGPGGQLGQGIVSGSGSAPGFLGVLSTSSPITKANITIIGNFFQYSTLVDNVAFGKGAAVPEPSSLVLLGLGLASIGIVRARRQARTTSRGPAGAAVLVLVLLVTVGQAHAYDFSAATSGAWNVASNWTPVGVPGASDNVNIGDAVTGSAQAAVITLTQDQAAANLRVGWIGQSTLDLGAHNLTVSGSMSIGHVLHANGGRVTRTTGTITARDLTVNTGSVFVFSAGDSVGGLQTSSDGAVTTTTSTSNVTSSAYTILGGTLNLGAPLVVSGVVSVDGRSKLDAGFRSITAGTIDLGSSSGPATLLNRGPLSAGVMNLQSENFDLAPVDQVSTFQLSAKSNSTLRSNSVGTVNLFSSSTLNTTTSTNITGSVSAFGSSTLNLGADVNLPKGLGASQGSVVNANGHNITASSLTLSGGTGGPAAVNDIGVLVVDSLRLDQGTSVTLHGVGNSIALGSLTNQGFSLANGSTLTYFQDPGSGVGLTFGTIAAGTFTIDSTSLLNLMVGPGSTSGWLLRWKDPSTGNRIGTLSSLISSNLIRMTGVSSYELVDSGGFTYLNFTAASVPEPSSFLLTSAALPLVVLAIAKRRRQVS